MFARKGALRLMCVVGGTMLFVAGCAVRAPTRRYQGVHLDLYCDVPIADPQSLVAEADRHVERVSTLLHLKPPPKCLRICVFPTHWSLTLFLARECPRQWGRGAACFETSEGFVAAIACQWRAEDTLRYLRHELTHYVLASHFHDLSPWIDEGLAQYCETEEPFSRAGRSRLKRVVRKAHILDEQTLETLVAIPAGERLTRTQYAQSYALVCFLIDSERFGLERILRYLSCVNSERSARECFDQCFGAWQGDLGEEWRVFIGAGP